MIEMIDGGYRVAETDTHYIDVMRMLFNWRIAEVPKSCPMTIDRFWCYAGTGPGTLLSAVVAAQLWPLSGNPEPAGWNKNGQTGEWREPGSEQSAT